MNYTPNQQEAIDARGENILVSAAAGSGKTRVLVDRIVEMVRRDHISLENMLIVTFTNAAAGEMKTRLRQGLEETALEAQGEEKAFLLDELGKLPQAHISTMHAFCIAELRRFYHVLGLDPNFKILPETTTTILREEALEEAMDAAYAEGDEAFLDLVAAYGGKGSDEDLRTLVRSVYHRIQSHQEPLDWLDAQIDAFRTGEATDATAFFMQEVEATVGEMQVAMASLRPLAEQMPNAEKLHLMISEDESIAAGLVKACQKEDAVSAVMDYIEGIKWERKPTKPKKAEDDILQIDATIALVRDGYKEALKPLKELSVEGGAARMKADREMVYPILLALGKVERAYHEAYQALKAEKQGLDFNDLEHNLLHLLEDAPTKAAIQEEIGYIFFDEYQDANPIQEAIVEALKTPNQLFFVGDVKQAIYRFRRADPNIFNRRYARYQENDDGRLIFLSENFRSRGEILNFSNALFGTLMTKDLGDVDYNEPGQAFICGGSFEPDDEAVQMVAVEDEEKREGDAEWIVQEIERLVDSGRYGYGDIVVLMRSPRGRLRDYEEVFKRHRIPYYSDNSVTSFHNLEVRLFRSMLTVVNNDENDNDLLAALISPFGGLSDDDIAAIRIASPEGAFFEAVRDYRVQNDDAISQKLAAFYERVEAARHALRYDSAAEVALWLFEESGFSTFLLGLEGGVECCDNVYAFIDMIGEYESTQRYGLVGFLHYVDTLEARSMDSAMPGIGLSENDSCVRIMSIHKSKGLGFKVVFLADVGRRFNFRDNYAAIVMDDAMGLGVNVVDLEKGTTHASFEKKIINLKAKRDTLSEEVRLLYVALTRAIDRLYLVMFADEKMVESLEKGSKVRADTAAFRKGLCYRDWLLSCMKDEKHPLYLHSAKELYKWHLVLTDEGAEESEEEKQVGYDHLLEQGDEADVQAMNERFNFAYPYQEMTDKPFKRTVSELTKGNDLMPDHVQKWPALEKAPEQEDVVMVPRFIREHVSFTGASMGTLMHQVVQYLPVAVQTREEIVQALDTLEAKAFLTREERAAVDVDILENFYQSDFVARIQAIAKSCEHEVAFTMRVGEDMVDGQIDFFYETNEGYEIVDFKTDRRMNATFYKKQLDMYAQALSIARGKPVVKKWLYWLRFAKAQEV